MTPVVQDDLVLISSAYYRTGSVLLRVAPGGKSVTPVWSGLQLEIHWTRPVLLDGYLYSFSGRNEPDAILRCVEFASGKVAWECVEGWPNAGHAKLTEGEKPPDVYGRGSPNPDSIEELARWQVPQMRYPCWTAPVLANKRLYLRDEDHLVCYDLEKNP